MRRLPGLLPAWLILMVIITAIFTPMVGAEELGDGVYEPFPEDDEAPLISQLDLEQDSVLDGQPEETFAPDSDAEFETIEPGAIEDAEIIDTDEIFAHDGSAETASVFSSADDLGACCWYARADFVLWVRSTPTGGVLAIDTSEIFSLIQLRQAIEPLNSVNGSYRIEPGVRLTLARNLGRDYKNRDHTVEVSFLGGLEWFGSGGKTSRDPASLMAPQTPTNIGGFNRADTQTFTVQADFNSIEANVRLQGRPQSDKMVLSPDGRWSRQMNDTFLTSLMFGMRYIRSTEQFHWDSVRNDSDPLDGIDDSGSGDLNIATENNLVGLHAGTDTYWNTPNWRIGMRTQFGVMVNLAKRDTDIVIVDDSQYESDPGGPGVPPTLRDVENGTFRQAVTNEAAAFTAEMGWSGTYQVNPCSSFRVAYDFLWMQGFADATRQIDFNFASPGKINFGGNVFHQGFSIGFERTW